MKKAFLIVGLAIAGYIGYFQYHSGSSGTAAVESGPAPAEISQSDGVLATAFKNHLGNIQVQGEGVVTKVLADDNDGIRHQRFIIRLGSGQTILIAHNIDLAPRVSPLREGDSVVFNGTYEWNAKGGVVHWTHRDPSGRHSAGWLRHNGDTFQ